MRLHCHIRQGITIWLAAILVLLSFVVSAHSVTHLDDGAKTHCTLCIQQHQFKHILLSQPLQLDPVVQQVESLERVFTIFLSKHVSVYLSRGPPV